MFILFNTFHRDIRVSRVMWNDFHSYFNACSEMLNDLTIPDRYPLPYIHDFSLNLVRCMIFSKIDLMRAYHQIPNAPYIYTKRPLPPHLGCLSFYVSFQRFMNQVLRNLNYVFRSLTYLLIARVILLSSTKQT